MRGEQSAVGWSVPAAGSGRTLKHAAWRSDDFNKNITGGGNKTI